MWGFLLHIKIFRTFLGKINTKFLLRIRRFELHYYTCAGCYLSMTIDNRTQESSDSVTTMTPGSSSNGNAGNVTRDDIVATPLERLIHTKWAEAKISLKGPPPASLSYWGENFYSEFTQVVEVIWNRNAEELSTHLCNFLTNWNYLNFLAQFLLNCFAGFFFMRSRWGSAYVELFFNKKNSHLFSLI